MTQLRLAVREHDPCRGHVQQLHGSLGETVKKVDDVEVVDERVGERHERLDHLCFSRHSDHLDRALFPFGSLRPIGSRPGVVEPDTAGQHVGGDGTDRAVLGERVGA